MRILSALSNFHPREFNRNVRLFFLYGISINGGMALFTLLYNLYLLRLSYEADFIGQVAGMAPLASALLALPIGMLSDRFGRKPFLVASCLLMVVSQVGLCLATASAWLLAFSFLGGMAMACIWVNHVPFLSDNAAPARRAEALVLWSALQIVVRMFLSLLGGFLPGIMGFVLDRSAETPEPFRYALLFGAFCSLVAVVPLIRMPSHAGRHTSGEERNREPESSIVSQWRAFIGIAALSGTRGFSMGLTFPFFNVFFEEELHVGATAIGVIFFLSQLVSLPSTFAAPTLVRRFGATLTILPLRSVGGLAVGVMGTVINLPIAVITFLLARAVEVVDNPTEQNFSTQILPRRYLARIQGFRVCGFHIFSFAGSILGGLLILDYGYGAAFGLACLARIASGVFMAAYFGLRPVVRDW